jgi:hypothetical protein
MFKIGHGIYNGTNRLAYAKSKAEAVRILRDRGVKRDDARNAVKSAAEGSFTVCYPNLDSSPIEVKRCSDI